MRGALQYNENKVMEGKADLIMASGFAGNIDRMNFNQKLRRFENLLMLNPKVKTNTLHISLNFHSAEKLRDYKLQQIALTYMDRIGFGDQPFLVYRHNDAGHDHIHIVTTNVQADGERIDLHNIGANQSEKARKEIEIEFDLVKAESNRLKLGAGIGPVEVKKVIYGKVPTKRAVANTVNAIIGSYKFTSVAELNAVLKQFNVVADRGAEDTLMFQKKGLVYSLLDEKGNKVGVPIKSSSLHSKPTLPFLEKQFVKHAESRLQYKPQIKKSIDKILATKPRNQEAFIKAMAMAGINAAFRIGTNGQAFGITYVDNWHKTVFNGSDLGKAYSAKAVLANLETNRRSTDALQMSIKSRQTSISSIENRIASQQIMDITNPATNLLETMLKDQFDPSGQPPKKRKRKKLNL